MNPILNYDENFKVLQVRPKKIVQFFYHHHICMQGNLEEMNY